MICNGAVQRILEDVVVAAEHSVVFVTHLASVGVVVDLYVLLSSKNPAPHP